MLGCKIVAFYSAMGNDNKTSLATFQTVTPAQEMTHYLLLHDDYYHGIKNVKAFLGVTFFVIIVTGGISVDTNTFVKKKQQYLLHGL